MTHQDVLTLNRPIKPVDAVIHLPGSKSLTNRALLLASLADGISTLNNLLVADDTRLMVDALRCLGVSIRVDEIQSQAIVRGCGGLWPNDEASIDAGHAGTVARFITAACCTGHGQYVIDGSPRMRQRPIGPLIDGLRELGAHFDWKASQGYLPIAIAASGLRGATIKLPEVVSSQFISALLMISPLANNDVFVELTVAPPSRPYIAMTLAAMDAFGAVVAERDMTKFIMAAPQRYEGVELFIEPDATAASYFWGAAALSRGRVTVRGLDQKSWQGDVGFVHVLKMMGCDVEHTTDGTAVIGPADKNLRGVDVDLNNMPDVAQTLAVIAAFAKGPTRMRNIGNLRVKETDRLDAVITELSKMNVNARVENDTDLIVEPPDDSADIRPATISTYNDHRMAMSFALASLRLDGMAIENPTCVSKTLPDFFDRWSRLSQ